MRVDAKVDPQEWDRFCLSRPDGHVLQTSAWAELKTEFGWQAERLALREGERLFSGAQVLFRPVILGWTIAYVPKGPLSDFSQEACQPLFAALHERCRARRAFALKIEPDQFWSSDLVAQLSASGFRPSQQTIQPPRTVHIDLRDSEEQILKRMKSKTRYNIRLAERKGVQVREGTTADVDTFNRLMAVTAERDAFGIRSPEYYARAYGLLADQGMAVLFVASCEGQPVAGLMAFACGQRAWYMYGASSDEHRDKMPNYVLQWAAIRWAKARGCHTYDLHGVPDHEEKVLEESFAGRSDGLWGVYRFKRGFGGQLVRYVGAFDYIYSRPLYWLYSRALGMR